MDLAACMPMMRDAILFSTHRVTQEEAIILAAIQCHVQFGDHNEQIQKPGLFENKEFLPREYCKIKGIEKKIFLEHKKWAGYRERDAKMKYTLQCRASKTYGYTFFFIKEMHSMKGKFVPRLLGISPDSVVSVDEETKEIITYWPLTNIRRWAASSDSFTLDFGDHSDHYYSVQTQEGEHIAEVLCGYADIALRERNPGNNVKGQACRARAHHQGPLSSEFVNDGKKRRETKSKRMKTIKKNLETLHAKTGIECLLQWRYGEADKVESYTTDGCTIAAVRDLNQQTTASTSFTANPEATSSATYPPPPTPSSSQPESTEVCDVCRKEHIGGKRTCLWVNCTEKKCNFWAHALCVGLVGNEEDLKTTKYMCPEHIKKMLNKQEKKIK